MRLNRLIALLILIAIQASPALANSREGYHSVFKLVTGSRAEAYIQKLLKQNDSGAKTELTPSPSCANTNIIGGAVTAIGYKDKIKQAFTREYTGDRQHSFRYRLRGPGTDLGVTCIQETINSELNSSCVLQFGQEKDDSDSAADEKAFMALPEVVKIKKCVPNS